MIEETRPNQNVAYGWSESFNLKLGLYFEMGGGKADSAVALQPYVKPLEG